MPITVRFRKRVRPPRTVVRREPRLRRTSFAANACWDFFSRTNSLANRSPVCGGVRANLGEPERTPANVRRTPANVRRSSPECRCSRTAGEFAWSSPEFARVRASSRRTIVCRVYSQRLNYSASKSQYIETEGCLNMKVDFQ